MPCIPFLFMKEHYAEFRKTLMHRRALILNKLHKVDLERMELAEQALDSSGDIGDASIVDTGTDYFMALAEQDRRELVDIGNALLRMREGRFGICEGCEDEIPLARLRQVPQARTCIECQELAEARTAPLLKSTSKI